jgi:hypothetical protein
MELSLLLVFTYTCAGSEGWPLLNGTAMNFGITDKTN